MYREIARLLAEGDKLVQRGNFAGAIQYYNIAVSIDPTYEQTYLHRIEAYAFVGNFQAVLSDYDTLIGCSPDNPNYYISRADWKQSMGDLHGARSDYDKALTLQPKNSAIYQRLGDIKNIIGDIAGAEADYSAAIQYGGLYPQDKAYIARAKIKLARGDFAGAIQDYEGAIEAAPHKPEYYLAQGKLLYQQADQLPKGPARSSAFVDVMTYYQRALVLKPDYAKAYFLRSLVYMQFNDIASALKDQHKAKALGYPI